MYSPFQEVHCCECYRIIMNSSRVVLMGSDFELRLVSLVVRAREMSEDVLILDLGSKDSTVDLAREVGCKVVRFDGEIFVPEIAKEIIKDNPNQQTLLIHVNDKFKLRDLPLLFNRTRDDWDVHMSFSTGIEESIDPHKIKYSEGEISHLSASKDGLTALAEAKISDTPLDLSQDLKVRVLHSKPPPNVQQRESLATASKFAQLFYWMLESRHPLLLFGIPGLVLFIVGYKLSDNVLDSFTEWNQTTVGVGIAVIGVTLMGLFAMMVGLILYIMGKQVKQIQSQYNHWPKSDKV